MATKIIAQIINTSNFAGKQKSVLRDLFEANASLNSITPTGGALTVNGSISATGQVAASAFATTGYNASTYSAKLLLAGSTTADNFATFIATNGAGRTYYMGPGAGDGQVASFALYDNTSGATRWRSTATGFDVTGSISATANVTFSGLPTSASGLPSGGLWNDGGTIKIA